MVTMPSKSKPMANAPSRALRVVRMFPAFAKAWTSASLQCGAYFSMQF
jgi:hypothetical protein